MLSEKPRARGFPNVGKRAADLHANTLGSIRDLTMRCAPSGFQNAWSIFPARKRHRPQQTQPCPFRPPAVLEVYHVFRFWGMVRFQTFHIRGPLRLLGWRCGRSAQCDLSRQPCVVVHRMVRSQTLSQIVHIQMVLGMPVQRCGAGCSRRADAVVPVILRG